MTGIIQKVEQAIEPVLEAEGFELVMLEYVTGQRILRIFIDKETGISLDDCVDVSRLVGDILDGEGFSDQIDGKFRLEVSSPGLDRPLVKPKHFQRFVGDQVKLTTNKPFDGRRKFSGEILEADERGIRVGSEAEAWSFGYDQIERARLVPQF